MLAEVAILLSDLVETIKNNPNFSFVHYYGTVTALWYRISHHYGNEYCQSANIWHMVIVSGQMQIIQCFEVKYNEKN